MKVILQNAVTVNGLIAGVDNDTDWVSEEDWDAFNSLAISVGNIIVGRITFELMRDKNELTENVQTVVVSKSNIDVSNIENVHVVNSPDKAIELLKKLGFEECLVAGGGKLNSSFIQVVLVDELFIDVHPLALGKGTHLFSEVNFVHNLELLNTNKLSDQVIQLHYKVTK